MDAEPDPAVVIGRGIVRGIRHTGGFRGAAHTDGAVEVDQAALGNDGRGLGRSFHVNSGSGCRKAEYHGAAGYK